MKKYYEVEVFFRNKNSKKNEIEDIFPNFSEYKKETKKINFTTWENPKNEVLRRYPTAAFVLIHICRDIDEKNEKENFEDANLKLGKSNIHGIGVFAKRNIAAGETLIYLSGEIIGREEIDGDYPKGEWNAISSTHFLCRKERTIYGFINHSRNPNCHIDFKNIEVKTSRDIKKGEEITIDYRKEALPKSYLENFGKSYL